VRGGSRLTVSGLQLFCCLAVNRKLFSGSLRNVSKDISVQEKTYPRGSLTRRHIEDFQKTILTHYRRCGRRLPWRETADPYAILVSELMLQQTQVDRVIPKYTDFMSRYPDAAALARAPLHRILESWSGLGYNRRAIALKKTAEHIMAAFQGSMPVTYEELLQLPGIGPYTASAICVFAYNKPRSLIETNVRTVYIHFYFPGQQAVADDAILPLVSKTLYEKNPRRLFNALMDYGVMLKKAHGNPGRKSAHYARQSPFKGSDREIRGRIIKVLLQAPACTEKDLFARIEKDAARVKAILGRLEQEGFVKKKGKKLLLSA